MMTDSELKDAINKQVKHLHPLKLEECLNKIKEPSILKFKKDGCLSAHQLKLFLRNYLKLDTLGVGSSPIKKEFWLFRGWSQEETFAKQQERIKKVDYKKVSPYSRDCELYVGMQEDQITWEINSKRPTNIEYWEKKGFNKEDAKLEVFKHQSKTSKIGNAKHSHRDDRTAVHLNYWLKKGFTEDEAKIKLAERQDVNSLHARIKQFGIMKGTLKYLQKKNKSLTPSKFIERKSITLALLSWRNDKSISSENFIKSVAGFKKILLTKYRGHASKESLIFFAPLFDTLKDKFECKVGYQGNLELKLQRKNKKYFRFDFTIEDKKLIFEYDGAFFHTAENLELDLEKTQLAVDHGYKVVRLQGLKNMSDLVTYHENQYIIKQVLQAHNIVVGSTLWKTLKDEQKKYRANL